MGSITVNMFKPLVGKLDGGVTTGSLWPEEDATTTADEVDASLVGEYPGGYPGGGSKSESGAPYTGSEEVSALLTRVRHRELTYSACPFSSRAPLAFSSSKIIFKGISAEVGWPRVFLREWKYDDETNPQSRAVYRRHFRDRRNTRAAAQSLSSASFVTAGGANTRVQCAADDERRLTMCKFDMGVPRTRSLDVEHGRSDIPPFDEQRVLLTWKFIFLSLTAACHRFHGRQLIINRTCRELSRRK
jgi:hypothetical protein